VLVAPNNTNKESGALAEASAPDSFRGPGGRDLTYWTVLNNLKDSIIAPLASRFPSPEGERGFTDGRLHSFRHYFVTQCFASGVPEAQIIDWTASRARTSWPATAT